MSGLNIEIHDWSSLAADDRDRVLERPPLLRDEAVQDAASAIVRKVRSGGDTALRALTLQFDGVSLDAFEVEDAEFAAAEEALTAGELAAIELAIANVRRFHEHQLPAAYSVEVMPGIRCERVPHPIDRVGLYVPAGSAPLPSTVVMLAIPAAIAGCPRRIMCTPPNRSGKADPAVLVAARRAGVTEVYKVGGAQAIAAMAFGTESIPKVDKIFGPGNAWVTAAKNLVSTLPDGPAIDLPAGPSEVLVIAEAGASAEFVAADLLSQAEHGADSQVVLVTTDPACANRIAGAIEEQLALLERREIAAAALRQCRFIVAADLPTAVEISNAYAPEHLILHAQDPRALLPSIRNAGSVFLGRWSPESAGDYCSGTNHVLPTGGRARSFSGLGVDQFMRHMTVQELSEQGLQSIAGAIRQLATLEGLDAHAAAVTRRVKMAGKAQ